MKLIDSAVDRDVTARPPLPELNYFSFCDPSGGANDNFTCAIAHNDDLPLFSIAWLRSRHHSTPTVLPLT